MTRDWIDEGLRHLRERQEAELLRSTRRLHHTTVIKEQGPELMKRLVAEVGASVDEYNHKAGDVIEFQALPRGGFCVTKASFPSVSLECHPDYETHILYCNMTRTDTQESDPQEFVFNLDLIVDDAGTIALRYQDRAFQTLDEVVEHLVKPVLFPPVSETL
jgi:hypothetical protein